MIPMRVTDAYGRRYVPVDPQVLERALALLEGVEGAGDVARHLERDLAERYELPLPKQGPRYPWMP